jgi:Uma2 family endonuclease
MEVLMGIPLPKRRFTVAEYYRMAEAGILRPEDRVELIEGEIVEMTPIGSRHAGQVNYLGEELRRLLGGRALVTVQNPVRLGDISELQPDLAVARRRSDFYRNAHPEPKDILFLIEVAETSADTDRNIKGPLYARAGIPEFWLVDLLDGVVEIYRGPSEAGWRERRIVEPGERISPLAFPDVELESENVLG